MKVDTGWIRRGGGGWTHGRIQKDHSKPHYSVPTGADLAELKYICRISYLENQHVGQQRGVKSIFLTYKLSILIKTRIYIQWENSGQSVYA